MSDPTIPVVKASIGLATNIIKKIPSNSLPYGKLVYSLKQESVNMNYLKRNTDYKITINEKEISHNIYIARIVMYNRSRMDIGEINKVPEKPIKVIVDKNAEIIQVCIVQNDDNSFELLPNSSENEIQMNYSCIKQKKGIIFDIIYTAKSSQQITIEGMLYQININKSDKSFHFRIFGTKANRFNIGFMKWFSLIATIVFGSAVPTYFSIAPRHSGFEGLFETKISAVFFIILSLCCFIIYLQYLLNPILPRNLYSYYNDIQE
jgi:hypothetical protein